MERTYKDETRWLGRVFAFYCVVLGIRILTVLFRRISEEQLSPLMLISLVSSVLFFWLAYRFLTCSSIWNMCSWFSKTFPVFQYHQSRYLSFNKYIRAGLVGGIISLMIFFPFPILSFRYKGVWLWETIKQVTDIILWPLRYLMQILISTQWPKEYCGIIFFICWVIYTFTIGFLVGVFMSYITGLFHNIKSPEDLNHGSPGCSETEPGG